MWDAEYPWDVRVEKVARSLTERGHRVHLVARNRDGRPLREELEEATVHRMAPWPVGARLSAASMFPAPFNPRWSSLLRRTAVRERCDLVLVRDLPLAIPALRVGRRLGLPVVLDVAEHYPAMMQAIFDSGRQRPLDHLVRSPRAVSAVERYVVRRVDHLLVVVEESADRLVELGAHPDRITLVSNTPPLERVPDAPKAPSEGDALHVVYLGLLEVPRGVGILLDAAALARDAGLPVRLTVIGAGRDAELFHRQAADLGLGPEEVRFLGFLPHAEALSTVSSGDVGAIPHFADESWNNTIPNKLFDYMSFGLPVVTSSAAPAARVVRETGCGEVFQDRDPGDLLRAWTALATLERRRACGRAGHEAVTRRYHWEADAERMNAALEGLVAPASSGAPTGRLDP